MLLPAAGILLSPQFPVRQHLHSAIGVVARGSEQRVSKGQPAAQQSTGDEKAVEIELRSETELVSDTQITPGLENTRSERYRDLFEVSERTAAKLRSADRRALVHQRKWNSCSSAGCRSRSALGSPYPLDEDLGNKPGNVPFAPKTCRSKIPESARVPRFLTKPATRFDSSVSRDLRDPISIDELAPGPVHKRRTKALRLNENLEDVRVALMRRFGRNAWSQNDDIPGRNTFRESSIWLGVTRLLPCAQTQAYSDRIGRRDAKAAVHVPPSRDHCC